MTGLNADKENNENNENKETKIPETENTDIKNTNNKNNNEIKKITSFTVDHTKLVPGIYVSRRDGDVTTYDLRVKKPNGGDYLSDVELHTFEHMFATYIRNSDVGENVIYFGPMGCKTGFYLLTRGLENIAVLKYTVETLEKIISHDGEVFGASAAECGNYKLLDLDAAKSVAAEYLSSLRRAVSDFKYPS